MLDILEWALAVIGFRFTRLDGRWAALCMILPASPFKCRIETLIIISEKKHVRYYN